ncbi:hypothetical protein XYCOK13_24610 [Xylanibacillus composti]|uniref:Uncharacterized protein n=1 Tax=Xylanibacillus composti TaxID=1572762 RepID=A0A8J4M357_9BACL|nr:hypothetical protein [Xylanibacillus composti]GIQ69637.1 hypothetical protein XYCOK13_24610 [Xylanibacillus composti]
MGRVVLLELSSQEPDGIAIGLIQHHRHNDDNESKEMSEEGWGNG